MVSDVNAGLGAADRRWVQVLGAVLPAGFRERQRGEWAADLRSLSADPVARRRYLLGVARTLPSLRAAARGHESALPATPGRPSAVTAWRVITPVLAWTTIGWLGAVVVPFLVAQAHVDPSQVDVGGWVTGPALLLTPFAAVAFWGGLATVLGPVLTAATSVTALVVGLTERRRSAQHRLGVVTVAVVLLTIAWVQYTYLYNSPYYAYGDSLAVLALAAVPLLTRGAGLPARRRIVLGVFAAAAAAIALFYRTPLGDHVAVWLLD